MSASLVGSEMCIRDRAVWRTPGHLPGCKSLPGCGAARPQGGECPVGGVGCLLYTSDAADDM
eukprot:11276022-Alexandrium_andersonii.AAC.1